MKGGVLYFAEDPGLVVGDRVVFDGVVGQFLPEPVDHLDPVEVEDDPAAGAAGDVDHLVGLQSDLHLVVLHAGGGTLVMKGIMKCSPGSVQVLRMAPPRL